MDYAGLTNLWQIGRSNKRTDEIEKRSHRKQIGKFGIGKLATYTIANQLTYVTKSDSKISAVTIDFRQFSTDAEDDEIAKDASTGDSESATGAPAVNLPNDQVRPIELPVYQFTDISTQSGDVLAQVLDSLELSRGILDTQSNWTLVILENLKPKAQAIKLKRLRWVLSTAMPLGTNFDLYLNKEKVESSKSNYKRIVEFNLSKLPQHRLDDLTKTTGETWSIKNGKVFSDSFPSGISGSVFVTEQTLYGSQGVKSDDIHRSHGFFVKVHGRLVDLVDPLFGMTPLTYGTLNRFYAEIIADDLDSFLTASRDTVEEGEVKSTFRKFLRVVFNEADAQHNRHKNNKVTGKRGKEGEKEIVAPELVERSVADALMIHEFDQGGAEADGSWFYIDLPKSVDVHSLAEQLYSQPRSKFSYVYTDQGFTNRLVKFDPTQSRFLINSEHDLVKAYAGDANSKRLLEDFATAEMLLEVYLREINIRPSVIGEVLARRDDLLRSLATDHANAHKLISDNLRDSASNDNDLEINLVVAARALGFNATQISGPDEPDGIARYISHPTGEQLLTLEAKSSKKVPQLGAIQFAGLRRHIDDYDALGCLLLAPSYPGMTKVQDSAASKEAITNRVSCWTIEDLARVVEVAEKRHINAEDIIQIVTTKFAPDDVKAAVDNLLSSPQWSSHILHQAILDELKLSNGNLKNSVLDVSMIYGWIVRGQGFHNIDRASVKKAVASMAAASQGGMRLEEDSGRIHLTVDLDELERRIVQLTKSNPKTRRTSSFRDST